MSWNLGGELMSGNTDSIRRAREIRKEGVVEKKLKHDDSPFGAGIEMMRRVILANSFSLSMIPWKYATITVKEVTLEEVRNLLAEGFESAIGHQSTADFLTKLLQTEVKSERKQVTLTPDVSLIVFQLLERLPEGRVLTEAELMKVQYKFYVVEVKPES
jgi:hypothetical protein